MKPNVAGTKCFCQCKLRPDNRSNPKWSIEVLSIRLTTWKEIEGVMHVLGRKDLDEPKSLTLV